MAIMKKLLLAGLFASAALAQSSTSTTAAPESSSTSSGAAAEPTGEAGNDVSATGCHAHGETYFCIIDGEEWQVSEGVDDVNTAPEEYPDCHDHGPTEYHCTAEDGSEITLVAASAEDEHDHEGEEGEGTSASASPSEGGAVDCHFHAGIEHCVDAQGNTVENSCAAPNRDYNIPLRIGLLFVILVTSAIGVFLPMLLAKFRTVKFDGVVFVGLRQFGTGIIISTALVHLFTHAQLYFGSECLNGLQYEATAAALVMAGLFVTFLIEFLVHHIAHKKGLAHTHHHGSTSHKEQPASAVEEGSGSDTESGGLRKDIDVTSSSVAVMEAGIVFHSILIGITLVVAGDSSFITLFVVILFHQMFEGIALGTRIAMMPASPLKKILLAALFAVITPIGMAIGIGVLSQFNGNDPSTIIAIGTLNAFSAGILLWIGLVEMWADEWWRGPLADGAGWVKVAVGMVSLVAGMVLMSVLGRWA